MDDETLINLGGEIKSLGMTDDGTKARIGGYLVRFGSSQNTDLEGDWFTAETKFGPSMGNGAPALIHHGLDLNPHADPETKSALAWTRSKTLAPLSVVRDEIGLFAETVCDMADKREAKIYELVTRGKLKWSSGADTPNVRRREGRKPGEILDWPIIEGSLTPIPAQHGGTAVSALKAFLEDEGGLDAEVEAELKAAPEIKGGKVLSTGNHARLSELCASVKTAVGDLETFLAQHSNEINIEPTPTEVKTEGASSEELKTFDADLDLAEIEISMMAFNMSLLGPLAPTHTA